MNSDRADATTVTLTISIALICCGLILLSLMWWGFEGMGVTLCVMGSVGVITALWVGRRD